MGQEVAFKIDDVIKRNREIVDNYRKEQTRLKQDRLRQKMKLKRQAITEKQKNTEIKTIKLKNRKQKIFVQQENSFLCTLCDKKYFSKKLFDLHKYFHKVEAKETHSKVDSSTKAYICNFCEAHCSTPEKLASHIESHKENCKECDTTFANAFTLGIHMAEHDKDERICCPFCDYRGTLSHCLKTHLLTRHYKLKIFRCDNCGANYSSKMHLEEHIRFHHEKMEPHICIVCERRFIFKSSLKKHQINAHRPLIDGDVPSNYCILCKRTLNTVDALKKHVEEKHNKKKPKNTERFICDICGKDFSHRQSWLLHTKGHSGLKPYKCKLCPKTFKVQAFLTVHEKIHSDEKPFSCEVCGAGFKRKEGLRRHLLTHTDIKPFVCPNCSKAFRRREHLRLHLKCCNKKHEFLLGIQRRSPPEQPQKNTSTSPEVPEGAMCSFCYCCGKEFDIFNFYSHECNTLGFDESDITKWAQETTTENNEATLENAGINQEKDKIGTNPQAAADATNKPPQNSIQSSVVVSIRSAQEPVSRGNEETSLEKAEIKEEDYTQAADYTSNKSSENGIQSRAVESSQKTGCRESIIAQQNETSVDKPSAELELKEEPDDSFNENECKSNVELAKATSSNSTHNNILESDSLACQPAKTCQNKEFNQLCKSTKSKNQSKKSSEADEFLSETDKSIEKVINNGAGTSLNRSNAVVDRISSFHKPTRSEATFCEFCGLQLSTLKDLKLHRLIAHDKDYFSCFSCSENFTGTSDLAYHHKINHYDSDTLKAELDSLNNTMATGVDEYRYYCNQCGEGFQFIHLLLSHKKKLANLGRHFLEYGGKAVERSLGKKQIETTLVKSEKRKKVSVDGSSNKKQNKKARYDSGDKDTTTENETPMLSENKKLSKIQIRETARKEMSIEVSKNKKNKFGHPSKKESDNNSSTQKQANNRSIEQQKKIKENALDKQTSRNNLDSTSKQSREGLNQNTYTDNLIVVQGQSRNERDTSNILSTEKEKQQENNRVSHLHGTESSKHATENSNRNNLKNGDQHSKCDKGNSDNKYVLNKNRKRHSKNSGNNQSKKTENRYSSNSKVKIADTKAQNPVNYRKIVDHKTEVHNKHDATKEKNEKKTVSLQKGPENSHKSKENSIEFGIIDKSILNLNEVKTKVLRVLIKKEPPETISSALTDKTRKLAEDDRYKTRTDLQTKVEKRENTIEGKKTIRDKPKPNNANAELKTITNSNEINDNQTSSKSQTRTKPPERIIKEVDIFNFNNYVATPSKKDLKTTVDTTNNGDIIKEPKEVRHEVKKKMSLQQYKQTHDKTQRAYSSTNPLIVTKPQISDQAMQIINEVTKEIETYNAQNCRSDNAQFSEEYDESESRSSHEKVTTIYCEACGHPCPNSDYLENHMTSNHAGFHFVCFVCDHRFNTLDNVIKHQTKYADNVLMMAESRFLRLRKSMPNMTYPYYCNNCGKGFTLMKLVAIHKKEEHDEQVKNKANALKIRKITNDEKGSQVNQVSIQNMENEEQLFNVTLVPIQDIQEGSLELNHGHTSLNNGSNPTVESDNCKNENKKQFDNKANILNIDEEMSFLNSKISPSTEMQELSDQLHSMTYQNTIINKGCKSAANSQSDVSVANPDDALGSKFPRFCESCGQKHLSDADQQKDLHLEKFKCVICYSPYETIDHLVKHYDFRHPKHAVEHFEYTQRSFQTKYCYYCKFCGKGFYFIGELLGHRECDHFELLPKENGNHSLSKINEATSEITKGGKEDSTEEKMKNDGEKNEYDLNSIITTLENSSKITEIGRKVNNKKNGNDECKTDVDCFFSAIIAPKDRSNITMSDNEENAEEFRYDHFKKYINGTDSTITALTEESTISPKQTVDTTPSDLAKHKLHTINTVSTSLDQQEEISSSDIQSYEVLNINQNSPNDVEWVSDSNIDENQERLHRNKINYQTTRNLTDVLELSDVSDTSTRVLDPPELLNISCENSDAGSLVMDLESLNSSEEKDDSNFIDAEEFIKQKQTKTQKGNKKNDIDSTCSFVDLTSEDWDEVARELADEVSLMTEENLFRNSQDEKVIKGSVDEKLRAKQENILKSCEEKQVATILVKNASPISEGSLMEKSHEDSIEIPHFVQAFLKPAVFMELEIQKTTFCEHCGQQLIRENYNQHFKKNHKAFKCSVCYKRFTDLKKLIKHQYLKYKLSTIEYAESYSLKLLFSKEMTNGFPFYCKFCGEGFNYTYKLICHQVNICQLKNTATHFQELEKKNLITSGASKTINQETTEVDVKCVRNSNIVPTANALTGTTNSPTCNICRKHFKYWHLLNEHRVLGCPDQTSQDIKTSTEYVGNMQLDCEININSNVKLESMVKHDSTDDSRQHVCFYCCKEFHYRYELTKHHCVLSQISSGSCKVPSVSPLLALPSFSQQIRLNVNAAPPKKTFICPVCPYKTFVNKNALEQHSKTSQKHIMNVKNNKIVNSKTNSSNLPITCLISEESPVIGHSESSFSSYLKLTRQPNSRERYLSPSRARSRSPPRSRVRTRAADLRRKSVEREEETKKHKDKKRKKKSKRFRLLLSERIRKLKSLKTSKSTSKKKNNDQDALEGIYTFKELREIYPEPEN